MTNSAYFSKFKFSKNNFGRPPLEVLCHTFDRYDKKLLFFFSIIEEFANKAIEIGTI